MMTVALSPTRDFQQRRRLSIDAEDNLFKSLQEVQELNNSQRLQRTVSPGNHSGRVKRSIDASRAGSPGKYGGCRQRRSFDGTSTGSPGSLSTRRQRRNSINNKGISPTRNDSNQRRNNSNRRKGRSTTPPRDLGNSISRFLQRESSGGTVSVRRPNRMRRPRTSAGMSDGDGSPGVIMANEGCTARSSDQTKDPEIPPIQKGRTKHCLASPKLAVTDDGPSSSALVMRSFTRRRVFNASPTGSPTNPLENVIYPANKLYSSPSHKRRNKEWTEMTTKANNLLKNAKPPRLDNSTTSWASFDDNDIIDTKLIKNAKPPRLNNSTTSWASFDDDDDDGNIIYQSSLQTPKPNKESTKIAIRVKPPRLNNSTTSWASFDDDDDDDIIGSDVEKPEHTASTKIVSERTASHSDHRTENADLRNLLGKLRDPAELERMKAERERLSQKTPSAFKNTTLQASLHDKVTEQNSSRNLKTFLQRSKRGYSQQANLDGLSVIQ